ALKAFDAPDVRSLITQLAASEADTVWFLPGDRPSDLGPRATVARIVSWDGVKGEVDHDGACDLVIRRTYAPGWIARIDDSPPTPVLRVDGGLQGVRMNGGGR